MSRVGKAPIKVPAGVKVDVKDGRVFVEGPKGKLSERLADGIQVKMNAGQIEVSPVRADAGLGALHGVTRSVVANMITGVSTGFTKEMDIVGVGYRAAVKGSVLSLTVGYSHPINYEFPTGISGKVDNNTHLTISGADKVLVGMVAAKIRGFRAPEPYQGKGIKYTDERIVRKQGKAAGAK